MNGGLAGGGGRGCVEAEAARGLAERRGEGAALQPLPGRDESRRPGRRVARRGAPVADLAGNWRGGRPDVRGWEWYYFNGLMHRARDRSSAAAAWPSRRSRGAGMGPGSSRAAATAGSGSGTRAGAASCGPGRPIPAA